MDSTSHALIGKVKTNKTVDHPITIGFPQNWESRRDELYLVKTRTEGILPLVTSSNGKHELAWLHTFGKGQIFATSLGNGSVTLDDTNFQQLVANGMAFILGQLSADGEIKPEALGNQVQYNYSKSIKCLPGQIVTPNSIAEVQGIVRCSEPEPSHEGDFIGCPQ